MKLSERIGLIKPSATLAVSTKCKQLNAQGIRIINLSAGEPDFDTPENIKQAAIEAINNGFTKYTAVGGIDALKEAIVKKFRQDNNIEYGKENICVSDGAKHTLFNLFQVLLDKGDEVILPAPYWVSYEAGIRYAGANPIIVPTAPTGYKILPEALEEKITSRTKMVVLNSPSNPVGSAYSKAEIEKLTECALKHNLFIVSDEIYEKIVYDGFKPVSPASLSDEAKRKTLTVNGVSKTYSMTGWRIGWVGADSEIVKAMTKLQSQSTSNPCSIAQAAAVEALNGSQKSVEIMVDAFKERRDYFYNELKNIKGINCFKPNGAFYLFPDISGLYGRRFNGRKISSSIDFANLLIDEAKVASVPGIGFGDDNSLRFSYAASMEDIKEAVESIKSVVSQLE